MFVDVKEISERNSLYPRITRIHTNEKPVNSLEVLKFVLIRVIRGQGFDCCRSRHKAKAINPRITRIHTNGKPVNSLAVLKFVLIRVIRGQGFCL